MLGNITNKSDVGNYQYNNPNPYQATNIAGVTGTYDLNGNLTHAYNTTMVYDFNDRMTKVTVGSTVADYYYDHGKTRIAKYNPATGAFKLYPNQYYEYLSTGTKDRYLFLGNQRLGVTERVGTSTPQLFLNFSDHLNSSSVTTDSQGNVTNLIDYYPYGTDRVNVKVSSFSPTYKFTDQENDPESGLMYYDARYYRPDIGRFTQSDPLSLKIALTEEVKNTTGQSQQELLSNPQVLNSYAYTANNPVKYTDPDGEFLFLAPLLYSAAVYVIANTTWDAVNVGLSAYYFSKKQSSENAAYLAGDLAALSSPIMFGGFGAYNKVKNYNKYSKLQNKITSDLGTGYYNSQHRIRGLKFNRGALRDNYGSKLQGRYNIVVNDGEITLGKESHGTHADLIGGRDVDFAGSATFSKGELVEYSNRSGHYETPGDRVYILEEQFEKHGIQYKNKFKPFTQY